MGHCLISCFLTWSEFLVGNSAWMEDSGQLKRALVDFLAGAISGGISRTITSPLDVIKIRFQVQLEPTSSWVLQQKELYRPSKYTGVIQAAKDILREEGFPGLGVPIYHTHHYSTLAWGFWKGNVPGVLLYMPYTAIQFAVLHKLKSIAAGSSKTEDHLQLTPVISYVSGSLAGCAATLGSYPFDLLRTVLASQGEPKVYPNMRSAFLDIVRTRGIRGLYAGLSPTIVEIIPYAGLQFGSYDTFKHLLMAWNRYRFSHLGTMKPDYILSSFQLFFCGLAAGACAKAICHPLDVVKKRFQIEGLRRHPKYGAPVESHMYQNMYHALLQILRKEGWPGLYKGIVPSLVKSAPAGAVTFMSYEIISVWIESLLK